MGSHPYSNEHDRPHNPNDEPALAPKELDKNDPSKWKGHTPGLENPYTNQTDSYKSVMDQYEHSEGRDQ